MQQYSNANSYAECVLEFARTIGNRVALKSPEASCTYAELADRASHYAAILRDLGVERGDRIAILTTPRVDSVVLLIAMNMVGAIWVCLNPQYRLREFQYVIEDAQPSLLFHISGFEGRSYLEDVEALRERNPCLTDIICLDDGATPGKRFSELKAVTGREPFEMESGRDRRFDAAVIVYTSGSSGNPKGAVLPNHGMMERGRGYNKNARGAAAPHRWSRLEVQPDLRAYRVLRRRNLHLSRWRQPGDSRDNDRPCHLCR